MTLRLFHYHLWPDAQAVRIGLLELGEDHEVVTVDMAKKAHLEPSFLAMSPGGEPPVLVDSSGPHQTGQLAIFGALPVAKYCDWLHRDRGQGGPKLFPSDPAELPPTDQWATWTEVHLLPPLERMLLAGRIPPRGTRNLDEMYANLTTFRRGLDILEQKVPANATAWMNRTVRNPKGSFGWADIVIGTALCFARLIPANVLHFAATYPTLADYVTRLEARKAFKTALTGATLPPGIDLLEFPTP